MADTATTSIAWTTTLEAALEKARQTRKPVFMDFFNPG